LALNFVLFLKTNSMTIQWCHCAGPDTCRAQVSLAPSGVVAELRTSGLETMNALVPLKD
jgi:hypothetical protein